MIRKCVTISGGYDSGCLPFIITKVKYYDFIFFDYNQMYRDKELEKALKFSKFFNKKLKIIKIEKLSHNHERRNFIFISKLKELDYKEIIMGNRNYFPFLDKYKDSNYIYLKIISFLFNIKIKLPLIGWRKKRIINFLKKNNYFDFYNCYNNQNNYKICSCANCLELRSIL